MEKLESMLIDMGIEQKNLKFNIYKNLKIQEELIKEEKPTEEE
jgi:hypothetical protein